MKIVLKNKMAIKSLRLFIDLIQVVVSIFVFIFIFFTGFLIIALMGISGKFNLIPIWILSIYSASIIIVAMAFYFISNEFFITVKTKILLYFGIDNNEMVI